MCIEKKLKICIKKVIPEKVVVTSCHDGGVCSVPSAFKLIKDAIVLVQGTQFGPEILMHLNTR